MGTRYSQGVRRSGREADHSPPPSTEVKNVWSYTFIPPIRLHDVVLKLSTGYVFTVWYLLKHRDNFNFTLRIFTLLDGR